MALIHANNPNWLVLHQLIYANINDRRLKMDTIFRLMHHSHRSELMSYIQNICASMRKEYGQTLDDIAREIRDAPDFQAAGYLSGQDKDSELAMPVGVGAPFSDVLDRVVNSDDPDLLFALFCFSLWLDEPLRDHFRHTTLRDSAMFDNWCDVSIKNWMSKFLDMRNISLSAVIAEILAEYCEKVHVFET